MKNVYQSNKLVVGGGVPDAPDRRKLHRTFEMISTLLIYHAVGRPALWPPRWRTIKYFRLCLGSHPSVRCADSFPQGKPKHIVRPLSKIIVIVFTAKLSERSRPFPTVHSAMCDNYLWCIPPVGAHSVRPRVFAVFGGERSGTARYAGRCEHRPLQIVLRFSANDLCFFPAR
jgi:hypothetical protein